MLAAVPNWLAPALTREGQRLFWDHQAEDYDEASLTSNASELALVRVLCDLFCEAEWAAQDLIALGCGTGSRDPETLLACLQVHGNLPLHVYLNDLSEHMVKRAVRRTTSDPRWGVCKARGYTGAAAEALRRCVTPRPRRVILGVYRIESFVRAFPHYGHPRSGFDEYMENSDRLGPYFQINDMHLQGTEERFLAEMRFVADGDERRYDQIRDSIRSLPTLPGLDVTRVMSWAHHGDEAFFLSHWFTEAGIRRLIATQMGEEQEAKMSLVPCAKSFVICLDPPEEPRGIVTMLNNSFGNMLPSDWSDTLAQLKETCCL
ncbi:MAG TPA: hypothetical protein VEB18_03810 [Candidatus Paceibacterota bacterium]|nr:hypothetical protein [Candidatus Paceibacterota bacterium]